MDVFQLTVLSIFVVLAILLLVAFSLMITSKKDADSEYPATYANCPDYWTMNDSGNCVVPNSINRGNNTDYSTSIKTPGYNAATAYVPENINFKADEWNTQTSGILNGLKGRCALKMWANTYNVKWDGVNNYNSKFC